MKNSLKTAALAALMVGFATAAHAQEGWYGRGDVGYSVDGQIRGSGGHLDLDNDWMADAGLGYGWGGGWRMEGELAYRQNDLSPGALKADAWSLMINGLYDFNRGGTIQPYLGLGVGGAHVRLHGAGSASDSSWAWQGLAGVGFQVSDRATIDLGYRYFRAEDLRFSGSPKINYTHQAVTLGLRWQFAAPTPPPPPPPPPEPPAPPSPPPPAACPQAEFTVYFEWDRSNLNAAAMDVINQAVQHAQECHLTAVVAVGHTDTSGSNAYNQGLSVRRANVVRDALVSRGISASVITTQGVGETDLARPTPNGVREPLNRRTVVTISFQ